MSDGQKESFHIRTPLVHSPKLSQIAGRKVLLKLDNLQPAGSFKIRGIGNTCQSAIANGAKRLVGSSGGNAGVAMAHAAEQMGIPLSLFVPKSTKKEITELIKTFSTTNLTVTGHNWDAANAEAEKLLAADPSAFFVHPFSQETTWTGHSTIIQEIREQMGGEKPAAVVTCAGGGGLAIGIILGMKEAGWEDVPLVVIETEGAKCFALSLQQGKRVVLDDITTIATSMGARAVDPKLLELAAERPVVSRVVTDTDALKACYRFSDDHRLMVEPACGAVLCGAYQHRELGLPSEVRGGDAGGEDSPLVMVVCGGNMASINLFEEWRQQLDMKL